MLNATDLNIAKTELAFMLTAEPYIAQPLLAAVTNGLVDGRMGHRCVLAHIGLIRQPDIGGPLYFTRCWLLDNGFEPCQGGKQKSPTFSTLYLEHLAFYIKLGDTPENNHYSWLLKRWIEEFIPNTTQEAEVVTSASA